MGEGDKENGKEGKNRFPKNLEGEVRIGKQRFILVEAGKDKKGCPKYRSVKVRSGGKTGE